VVLRIKIRALCLLDKQWAIDLAPIPPSLNLNFNLLICGFPQ
jgi:hypothetical protein